MRKLRQPIMKEYCEVNEVYIFDNNFRGKYELYGKI